MEAKVGDIFVTTIEKLEKRNVILNHKFHSTTVHKNFSHYIFKGKINSYQWNMLAVSKDGNVETGVRTMYKDDLTYDVTLNLEESFNKLEKDLDAKG